jgi:uncharacterized protein YjbI with pentapeptide repeats
MREGAIADKDLSGNLTVRVHEGPGGDADAGEANFSNANLERANLSGLVAIRTDFGGAIMRNCKLVRANLKQANFRGANLDGSDLAGADLTGADFTDSVLTGVDLSLSTVSETVLDDILTDEPSGKPMREVEPAVPDQLEAHILFVETNGEDGTPADLSGVDLRPLKLMAYLNLPGLKARETTFYGLDMTAIMLQGANLEGADLRGAKLQGADLRGINLTNARLSGADLRDCNMQPLVIDSERRLPVQLTGANLTGADLRGTDISQAVHEGAILEDACTDDDEVAAGG